jgi:cytochrome c oxidase assembly protein subunit 11
MAPLDQRNRQLMAKLIVVSVGMLGFGFAMVPMYRQICEALGITQGRVVAATNTQVDRSRSINVEMLASSSGLGWKFEALDKTARAHPGEYIDVRYRVENTLGRAVTAHAVMNTAPSVAMKYIEKQACFCFSNQTLQAGEAREMPVRFRVSPEAPKDLDTVSLSYTFFEVPGKGS